MSLPLYADAATDPVRLVRYSLERRQFTNDAMLVIDGAAPPRDSARNCTLFEPEAFMEAEPERLGAMAVNLLGAVHSAGLELVLWVHGDGERTRFFYGVVESESGVARPARNVLLRKALEGFFRGVEVRNVTDDELRRRSAGLLEHRAVGAILGLPSDREGAEFQTALDDALEALCGNRFDLILQCQPASMDVLDRAEENLSFIANSAHRLASVTVSENEARSFSESVSLGITEGRSASETRSWSTSTSTGTSKEEQGCAEEAAGGAVGMVVGAAIGGLIGSIVPGAGTAIGAQFGGAIGTMAGGAAAARLKPHIQKQEGTSESRSDSRATSRSSSVSSTNGSTEGETFSNQVSFEAANRQARSLEELAEAHLDRFRRGRAVGSWLVHIHLAADNQAQMDIAGHALMGALRGDESHLEPVRLCRYDEDSVATALRCIAQFRPPRLTSTAHPFIPHGEQPLTHLTTPELAHWFQPPGSSVAGVLVQRPVTFSRYSPHRDAPSGPAVKLGPITYWGRELPGRPLSLEMGTLTRHVFVAGSTGSGKTTTVQRLLWDLHVGPASVPFMVIEPAKAEYRELFDALVAAKKKPLRLVVGKTSSPDEASLRFNPFVVPAGIPVGRHVEALKILLRSCFDMQESLPQLLERVLFRTYADYGFTDLAEVLPEGDRRRFPVFASMAAPTVPGPTFGTRCSRIAAEVQSLPYEERVRANLSTALTVRIESFTRGLKGEIFGGEELSFSEILTRPTFIELSDVNEPDVKRFLLGALFLRIYSEREAERRRVGRADPAMRHLLVLEEAHHFLREGQGSGPSAELIRQSNSMIADAFAELRSYGQGIMVADQAPAELSPAVLRNTATKIAHALFYQQDCQAMGDAMGLSEEARDQLRRLRPGECVVSAPHLPLPVTCRVTRPSIEN